MTHEVRQEFKSSDGTGRNDFSEGNHCCPRCGSDIVATGQGVTASFPSPALERLVCSHSGCNYVKYVKLGSDGFGPKSSPATNRGVQSA